ncbi:uncharacterized protein LOC115727440 [Rhodamnia argentea]|uniref:Uncharacterized protein LOC115727440 n=1 Tax=Rhodamnia argentea TaxID=178133 RepID=A0A8B8MTW7_9MYRT|nr:uncharacterized protein LOC115727440 [Rhodamnia argentea]
MSICISHSNPLLSSQPTQEVSLCSQSTIPQRLLLCSFLFGCCRGSSLCLCCLRPPPSAVSDLMSRRGLGKKLLPAKKAWKAITDNLRSRLNKLKNSRFIEEASHRLLSSRFTQYLLSLTFRGRRCLARTSPYRARHHLHRNYRHYKYQCHDTYEKNFAPIFIDVLFDEPLSASSSKTTACAKGETSRPSTEVEGGRERECDMDERWRAIVAMSPQLRLDERAEEFISKFKEDMKLQRERSDSEFQERLKRSA